MKRSRKGKSAISSPNGDVSGSSQSDVKNEKQIDEEEKKVIGLELNEDELEGNHFQRKKVVLGVESAKNMSVKRKGKVSSDDVQKKPKIDKGKSGADSSWKREAKSHLALRNSQIKQKSVKHSKAKSLSKNDMGNEIRYNNLQDEVLIPYAAIIIVLY